MGTVGVVRFEMDTKVVDESDRLDRVRDRGDDFVYGDEETGATQRGVKRNSIGFVVVREEVISWWD